MTRESDTEEAALECLKQAVAEALERKRRLGQYAVVWRGDHPEFIGPNPPAEAGRYPTEGTRARPGVAEPRSDD